MTVQVAFELRRRARGAAANALFFPTRDASVLLAACARLGLGSSDRVRDLDGGFLLELDRPTSEPFPGATRLRALSPHFYLPVDADLVPDLLDDEAAGLARDGGIVLLPGGRALRFDSRTAVELSALLTTEPRPRRGWAPLPEPRRFADRITEISREWPDVPPEAVYRELERDLRRPGARSGAGARAGVGGAGENQNDNETENENENEGDGEDESKAPGRPGGSGATEHANEGAEEGEAGGGPTRGRGAGGHGLFDPLRTWMGRLGAGFSAFQEKAQWEWIDHSALVRKLLHEFREGDPSRALRHAFSMVPADPRHSWHGWGNRLPWGRAVYDLLDLIGRPGRGQSIGIWRTRPDLVDELTREYRKAAEQAIRQGDFRRAAYIYGRLLGDDRLAAVALQRGGLHRDAAILYLKKLNDAEAAAQAFEAAGAADRAIALYRQLGQHEAAGDLLRRIGEEDAAVAEYRSAAARAETATPPDHYRAGMILSHKARRPDLAIVGFQAGWDRRPGGNATLCAIELVRAYCERGAIEPIRALLDEADAFFRPAAADRGGDTVHAFYNTTVWLVAGTSSLASFADEVRDRALLALTWRLRHDVELGQPAALATSALFGESSLWPAALVRDAGYAATAAQNRSPAHAQLRSRDGGRDLSRKYDPREQGIQVGIGEVTAATQASATSELFLGFDDGRVVSFRPGRNQIVPVAWAPGTVAALATDPDGQVVVALRPTEHGARLCCSTRRPDGRFRTGFDGHFPAFFHGWLTPVLPWGAEWLVGLGGDQDFLVLDAVSGMPASRLALVNDQEDPPATAVLIPAGLSSGCTDDRVVVLTHHGPRWSLLDTDGRRLCETEAVWCPAIHRSRPLAAVPLTWSHAPPFVDVLGLDKNGAVYVSQFHLEDGWLELLALRVATTEGGYVAATRSGMNTVVAMARSRIVWLRYRGDRFQTARDLSCTNLSSAVACFPSAAPQEILVVFADGLVGRVAPPARLGGAGVSGT